MLLVAALLALAAPAHAAPPPERVAGVKISWPSATTVQPGTKLTVKVVSKHRRAQLAFIQLAPRRTLARRTLRNGRFTVTVPATEGVRYELRATIAGRRYSSLIATPAAAEPAPVTLAPTPVATPAPSVPVPDAPCTDPLTGVGELAIVRTGADLDVTFTNRGPGCLGIPLSLNLAWDLDGEPVPIDCDNNVLPPGGKPPSCIGLPAMIVLAPGESTTRRARVPNGLAPGRYRVTAELWRRTVTAMVDVPA